MRAFRVLRLLLLIGFMLAVLVAGHWYIAIRLVADLGLAAAPTTWLTAAVGLLGASLLLQPVGERWLPRSIARPLGWIASLWMGFALLLIVVLGASELALWALGPVLDGRFDATEIARTRAGVVLWVTAVAAVIGMRNALRIPPVERVEIELARWPRALDGLRIAQISDVHIGPILDRDFARRIVDRVNALDAELVAITGDLVDGSVARLAGDVAPFGELRARHGVHFVTGNHDHYSGAGSWSRHLHRELGINVLRNQRVTIEHDGVRFDLAGVDDHEGDMIDGAHEDLGAALDGRDPARPVVLLAHNPVTFRAAAARGVDLQISGHTHGGQLVPFTILVRLVIPFIAGLHRLGRSTMYVSRGTGFWGPPMRLGAPAEITELVLRSPA